MQLVPRVGMPRDEGLIEIHAEPWLGRRDDVPCLPANWLHQDIGVKPLPSYPTPARPSLRAPIFFRLAPLGEPLTTMARACNPFGREGLND